MMRFRDRAMAFGRENTFYCAAALSIFTMGQVRSYV